MFLTKDSYHIKKYVILIALFVLVDIFLILMLTTFHYKNIKWFLNNLLLKEKLSYPTIVINNHSAGNVTLKDAQKIFDALEKNESEKNFNLSYNSNSWTVKLSDINLKINRPIMEGRLFLPNEQGLKTLLQQKNKPLYIEPTFNIDQTKCIEKLNQIISINQKPTDASIKISADQITVTEEIDGVLLDAVTTCQIIADDVANKKYTSAIKTISLPPKIKTSSYQIITQQIKNIISSPIQITYLEKKWELKPEQILSLIDLENGKNSQTIIWNEVALDDLVNKIAAEIGAANPKNKICEKNPNRKILKTEEFKSFIKELATSSTHSYALQTLNDDKSPKSDLKLGKGVIYLTFDDGLTYGDTIMDYADCYGVKITFFEIAARAKFDQKQLIRASQTGHSVQSHGFLHAVFDYGTGHSYGWQYNDILSSLNILKNITGKRPTFFRPPGGNKTNETYAAANAAGVKLILWNISSIDTKPIPASEICHNILSHAKNNGVALMHSTHFETAKAVPCIIEGLIYKGYSLQALE